MWRNLLAGCNLLRSGLVWQIGNGQKTKIWKDRWIYRFIYSNILSPNQVLDEDALVAELIDHENHCWKQDLINQIFNLKEAKAITAIPLSIIDKEDLMV